MGHLDRQAALTRRLLTARTVLERVTGDWSETVARELGAPVALRSSGPAAADKRAVRQPLSPPVPV